MDWKQDGRYDATHRPPRQPQPGEVLWGLRDADGRAHRCELRNDRRLCGRRDLQFFRNDEFLFSRMCSSDWEARMIATMARKELLTARLDGC